MAIVPVQFYESVHECFFIRLNPNDIKQMRNFHFLFFLSNFDDNLKNQVLENAFSF
jgi:hypothetical protein